VSPVLDVKDGQAVHAVGGIRSHYGLLRSVLHPSSDPVAIAGAYRDVLGFRELYLADLDAISGRTPNRELYRELASLGLSLWIDAGLKNKRDLVPLQETDVSSVIVGLETVEGPEALEAMLLQAGISHLVFSLDLFERRALTANSTAWRTNDPLGIMQWVVSVGVRRLILLDLSRVGTGQGPGTSELLAELRKNSPAPEITLGGGIAGVEHVLDLRAAGASAVLIGSAFHDGRIGLAELEQIQIGHSRLAV
jgi:phosphoribosylformimino-5-aminoimidazole carboxamide ribotide isomerase